LDYLQISKADILGFSNGGHTAIEMAIRHARLVGKLLLCSTFYKRSAAAPQFWKGFDGASLNDMPEVLRNEFLKVNNSEEALLNMFTKDVQRMKAFKDWSDEQIRTIKAPTLVINANADVGSPEHAIEMYRLLPNCELDILPGGHGSYLGAIESLSNGEWSQSYSVQLIEAFLDK
jgi:pimeloyl-ACP methyl ester carboxylesterase